MARRRDELERAAERARKQSRRRAIVGAILVVTLAVTGFTAREIHERRTAHLAAASPLSRTFAPLGFEEIAPTFWSSPDRLEARIPAGTCLVALGAAEGKPTAIEVNHDGDVLEAEGSLGFCTCNDETIVVAAKGATSGRRSVRLLKKDARDFGSVLGFERAPVKPASTVACACADDQLDGWLGRPGARAVLGAPDARALSAIPGGADLVRAGLEHTATAAPGATILPMEVRAEGCAIAIASNGGALALRAAGGARVLAAAPGSVAFCSKTARSLGVLHEGAGTVHVLRGEAARLGGRHELRRTLTRGAAPGRVWIDPTELAWDAELTLRAARAVPTFNVPWAAKTKVPNEARILLFALEGANGERAATSAGDAACERSDEAAPTLLCVQTSWQPWQDPSEKIRGSLAYAPLAPWLKPLVDIRGAAASNAALALVTLTRRLSPRGFEPTPLEGVTETASGADVLGRAGEDAVVAVTVQPAPPYLLPLTDGPGWTIDGAPRVVDLAPGRRISLRGKIAPSGDIDQRRTIVFRRNAGAPKIAAEKTEANEKTEKTERTAR